MLFSFSAGIKLCTVLMFSDSKASITLIFVLTVGGTKGYKHRGDICIENMTIPQNAIYDWQHYVMEKDCLFYFYLCMVYIFQPITHGLIVIIDELLHWDNQIQIR